MFYIKQRQRIANLASTHFEEENFIISTLLFQKEAEQSMKFAEIVRYKYLHY